MSPYRLLPVLLLALLIVSCKEEKVPADPKPATSDSIPQIVLEPMQGERKPGYDPANAENFQRVVYMEYAELGVQVPRRVADSIFRSTPMEKIESAMTDRIRLQDTIARAELAAKYRITVDSIDAIITIGRKQKWR